MGPTAAGKTALAMALCDQFPVRLISVDSAQVYRGLNIGSAKPDAATLARYPHDLIDIRDPDQAYSAADFAADAAASMRAAAAAGRWPVLVGGTSLYFRALLYGLDALPPADPTIRAQIAERASSLGWPALHAELERHDPATARRIRPSDPQRIQRALEVLELTGQGMSALQSGPRLPRFACLRIVLTAADRSSLHARIGHRVEEMMASGLVEETRALVQAYPNSSDLPALRSVGYRQVLDGLESRVDMGQVPERIVAATRQLAKRQLTSFRKFHRALWYDPAQAEAVSMVSGEIAEYFGSLKAG